MLFLAWFLQSSLRKWECIHFSHRRQNLFITLLFGWLGGIFGRSLWVRWGFGGEQGDMGQDWEKEKEKKKHILPLSLTLLVTGWWHLILDHFRWETVNPENTVFWFFFCKGGTHFYFGWKVRPRSEAIRYPLTFGPSCVMFSLCSTCWENALNNPVFWQPDI